MRSEKWQRGVASQRARRRARLTTLLLGVASAAAVLASPAGASLGYELDASNPSRKVGGPPRGIAIDQVSQDIYVAIPTTNPNIGTPGEIERFNSDLTLDGVFAKGGGYYTGVAVDPLGSVPHGFYGMQIKLDLSVGSFGTPRLDRFTASGGGAGSFALADAGSLPPIATDSAGNIFYPNTDGHSIQVFNSAGVLQEEIRCDGCPGGPFGKPLSVALDSKDDLYVADFAPDRVVKLTFSGGSYSYASTLQSGRGAAAVGVDPTSGDVLVGDLPGGRNYHIVAYDSSGIQFDDFGAGLFPDPPPETAPLVAYQMAVNATTHKLYVGEVDKFYVFEKVTIDPPTAAIEAPASVGQITATLKATVNASGHAALSCSFEYTEEADIGFTTAVSLPCTQKPNGFSDTALSVKASGLLPDTAYRYRVTATNNAGTVTSGSATFKTLPALPPTVTTNLPLEPGQNGATLRGTVNPRGGSVTDCHFEFGPSLSYGSSISCSSSPGPVTTDVAVARKIAGLTPGTAYHYRLVIGTNAGAAGGDDVEFTTASPPAEPEPEPEEPAAPPATPPPAAEPIVTPPPLHCRRGFHRKRIDGKVRCARICKRRFRPRRIDGKVKCVKVKRARRTRT